MRQNPISFPHSLLTDLSGSAIFKRPQCRFLQTKPIAVVDCNNVTDHSEEHLARVIRPYHERKTPLVIQNFHPVSKSDAIYCWRSLDYLRSAVGENTTCRVEMGGSYNDDRSKVMDIAFGDYISYMTLFHEKYGSKEADSEENAPKREEVIYLAQNDIFPGLLRDFPIPSLCQDATYRVGEGKLYSVMLWFGPRCSVSPLHFDPLDNLLVQFVGRKRVLLFPSDDSVVKTKTGDDSEKWMWHYAGSDNGQKNTSPVNVENVDLSKYPRFLHAPEAIEFILSPGEVLYIPERWWHHVRSLDTSVSANIWWR
jgi:hypothetical protein